MCGYLVLINRQNRSVLLSELAREQGFEFIKLDLTRAILVNFFDELLNVDGHLKFKLNGVNKFLGIDTTSTVGIPAHSNVGIK